MEMEEMRFLRVGGGGGYVDMGAVVVRCEYAVTVVGRYFFKTRWMV